MLGDWFAFRNCMRNTSSFKPRMTISVGVMRTLKFCARVRNFTFASVCPLLTSNDKGMFMIDDLSFATGLACEFGVTGVLFGSVLLGFGAADTLTVSAAA